MNVNSKLLKVFKNDNNLKEVRKILEWMNKTKLTNIT